MAVLVQRDCDEDKLVLELNDNEIIIGRQTDCGIAIRDLKISKHHARVLKKGPYYKLEDMGSMNGTFINGSKIRAAILKNGDRVRLGESILIYYEDMMQRTARCLNKIILSGV